MVNNKWSIKLSVKAVALPCKYTIHLTLVVRGVWGEWLGETINLLSVSCKMIGREERMSEDMKIEQKQNQSLAAYPHKGPDTFKLSGVFSIIILIFAIFHFGKNLHFYIHEHKRNSYSGKSLAYNLTTDC